MKTLTILAATAFALLGCLSSLSAAVSASTGDGKNGSYSAGYGYTDDMSGNTGVMSNNRDMNSPSTSGYTNSNPQNTYSSKGWFTNPNAEWEYTECTDCETQWDQECPNTLSARNTDEQLTILRANYVQGGSLNSGSMNSMNSGAMNQSALNQPGMNQNGLMNQQNRPGLNQPGLINRPGLNQPGASNQMKGVYYDTTSVETTSDSKAIAAKIKDAIKNDSSLSSISTRNTQVTVDDSNVVTLTGVVATDADKAKIETDAKQVIGVKSVNNKLTVTK